MAKIHRPLLPSQSCAHPRWGNEHKNDMIWWKILKIIPASPWETDCKAGLAAGRPVIWLTWRPLWEPRKEGQCEEGRGHLGICGKGGTFKTRFWRKEQKQDEDVLFAWGSGCTVPFAGMRIACFTGGNRGTLSAILDIPSWRGLLESKGNFLSLQAQRTGRTGNMDWGINSTQWSRGRAGLS